MNNPFDIEYRTPHDTAPFERIETQHFKPAILEGIKRDRAQFERIATNPEEPTFANTLGVVSDDNMLERASTVMFNLCSANTNDELDALAQELAPTITDHANELATDERMFKRVEHIYKHERETLTVEQQTLLQKTYDAFLRHGIGLPKEKQKRFKEIDRQVSQLTLQFAQNVLKATNDFVLHITDVDDLAGLPESAVDAAAQAAAERGMQGWVFTLHFPSMNPFMTYSERRHLRKQMYMAKGALGYAPCQYNNTQIVKDIVNLRREFAQLLGYECFADFVLEKRMATSTKRVMTFVHDLLDAYLPKAKQEVAEVEALAKSIEGADFKMQPWDFAYYCQKLKKQRYDIDSEMLRPYFKLEDVKKGVFGLATTLYGINFERCNNIPVYHPEVETYEVKDADGRFLAVLYADFHPRAGKQSGAWKTNYKEQFVTPDGTDSRPHVSIVMNLTRPTAQRPSLLSLREVETFLHEFGHALHGIFSQVRYQAISGTNVAWDFVELPSQFMENYATEPEWLATFAKHYETGEALPRELVERIVASKNFLCGYACVRQLSFCLLDMAYYTLRQPFTGGVRFFEQQAWRATQVLPSSFECCMSTQFEHIMSGGYSAGYYSYKWAEVLDADAFSLFRQNGIFDKQTAERFRKEVLARGGSEPPMELYKRFRGAEPTISALLQRNGI